MTVSEDGSDRSSASPEPADWAGSRHDAGYQRPGWVLVLAAAAVLLLIVIVLALVLGDGEHGPGRHDGGMHGGPVTDLSSLP